MDSIARPTLLGFVPKPVAVAASRLIDEGACFADVEAILTAATTNLAFDVNERDGVWKGVVNKTGEVIVAVSFSPSGVPVMVRRWSEDRIVNWFDAVCSILVAAMDGGATNIEVFVSNTEVAERVSGGGRPYGKKEWSERKAIETASCFVDCRIISPKKENLSCFI